MNHRRLVGIDLGIASAHTVRVLDGEGERAALDRRVRATDRLNQQGALHKRRIKDLVRQLLPMTPLTGGLGAADLAVLERCADPNALLKLGVKRLTAVIVKASNNHRGAERAAQWVAAAEASIELYAGHPAISFTDLAAEVATEVRLLRAVQAELATHAAERERCHRWVDPAGLARSLPGLAEVGGPALAAANLAERAWVVMRRGMPYVICDTDGRPVTPEEAKAIIAEHWTVPTDVRARRRSKKAGKAPQQVLTAQAKSRPGRADRRGDLPHQASSPATSDHVNRRTA